MRGTGRADPILALVLYAATVGIYAVWVLGSLEGPLTGEEASLSHLYVLAIPQRLEYSVYATNFASHLFYWVASHLDPRFDLFYGRVWKAGFTALIAPLAYLVSRRRLACRPSTAALGAGCAALLPGMAVFSWLATENGMEAVWGLAALYVATSSRRWWPAGLVLAGVAVSTYSSGLAWAGATLLVVLVRTVRAPRAWPLATAGALTGTAVVGFPLFWWVNGGVLVTGGGAFDPSWRRGVELIGLLARDGSSYYFFDDLPLLGSWPVALLALVAVVAAAFRRSALFWPYTVLAVTTVALYLASGNVTGSRRVIALTVVAGLAFGVAADLVPARLRPDPLAALLSAVLLATALGSALAWGGDVRGARAIPIDFPFPTDGAATQQAVLDRLDRDLRAGRTTVDQVARRYDIRTLAMLVLLAQRHSRPPALSPDDVSGVYARTELCRRLDGPACAGLVVTR